MIRTAPLVRTVPIRLLDIHRDLIPVADLIELCFSTTLDADGHEYLHQIRRAAVDQAYLRWVPGASERVSMPLFGYVWVEDKRIVGNLSLIPIHKNGTWLYLIANVAVHPEFRRHGIARELTLKALDHVKKHQVSSAWLQVRADNQPAIDLYRSTGFVERSRRTTWINPNSPAPLALNEVTVSARNAGDWERQRAWLNQTYPPQVTWNLQYDSTHFDPGFWRQMWRWVSGEPQEHWVARRRSDNEILGFASWESLPMLNDQIWIASPPEHEEIAIQALLTQAGQTLAARRRTLNVNYPAGRAVNAFTRCGYKPLNTLIWMENAFPR